MQHGRPTGIILEKHVALAAILAEVHGEDQLVEAGKLDSLKLLVDRVKTHRLERLSRIPLIRISVQWKKLMKSFRNWRTV